MCSFLIQRYIVSLSTPATIRGSLAGEVRGNRQEPIAQRHEPSESIHYVAFRDED